MDGSTAVKVGLCGAHLDGHTKPLQHLITTLSYDVKTNNLEGGRGGEGREGGREGEGEEEK